MKAKVIITIPENVMQALFNETEISTKEEAKGYLTAIWDEQIQKLTVGERFGLEVEVID